MFGFENSSWNQDLRESFGIALYQGRGGTKVAWKTCGITKVFLLPRGIAKVLLLLSGIAKVLLLLRGIGAADVCDRQGFRG